MKRIFLIFLVLICFSSTALAGGWWNDWREEPEYESSSDYDDGYENGYDDGYYDGKNDPFADEDDKAAAFGYWFLSEEWTEQELHAWVAVFEALMDGRDRYPWARQSIETPVYVAILTGTVYHKETCSSLSRSSRTLELDISEAQERGFKACSKCR